MTDLLIADTPLFNLIFAHTYKDIMPIYYSQDRTHGPKACKGAKRNVQLGLDTCAEAVRAVAAREQEA